MKTLARRIPQDGVGAWLVLFHVLFSDELLNV